MMYVRRMPSPLQSLPSTIAVALIAIHSVLSRVRWTPIESSIGVSAFQPTVDVLTPLVTTTARFSSSHPRHHHRVSLPSRLYSDSTDDESSSSSLPPPNVVCIGETLWDSLPTGIYLGGAPTNVAVHLASLFRGAASAATNEENNDTTAPTNPTVAISACLGQDQLGKEAHRRLALKGVRTDYLQYSTEWETGMSIALLDENGDATYEFNTPAAWDRLVLTDSLMGLTKQNDRVFVMGTIAGRLHSDHGATSLETLTKIRNSAPEGCVVLDVNLQSPWYTPEAVLDLARGEGFDAEGAAATAKEGKGTAAEAPKKLALLKLNEDELVVLEEWCGLQGNNKESGDDGLAGSVLRKRMEQLALSLNAQRVCVTRGKDGAALLCTNWNDFFESAGYKSIFLEHAGYSSIFESKNNDADTVGAGDAFLAALVNSLLVENEAPSRALERACALGGYVASRRGATPEHEDAPDDLKRVFSP